MLYLDSSAIVKLVAPENETSSLVERLRDDPDVVSSALARVEVIRAVRRAGSGVELEQRAHAVLDRVALVPLDEGILNRAASLEPLDLRSLDAIHLATALLLRDDIAGVVTYDLRLAQAAKDVWLPVLAPTPNAGPDVD